MDKIKIKANVVFETNFTDNDKMVLVSMILLLGKKKEGFIELKDISDITNRKIPNISRAIKKIQENGYVDIRKIGLKNFYKLTNPKSNDIYASYFYGIIEANVKELEKIIIDPKNLVLYLKSLYAEKIMEDEKIKNLYDITSYSQALRFCDTSEKEIEGMKIKLKGDVNASFN